MKLRNTILFSMDLRPTTTVIASVVATIFISSFAYSDETRVFTDSDLENIKQERSIDDESAKRKEAELKTFEQQREMEVQQERAVEQQKRDEKEIRAVWENMKNALSGKQAVGKSNNK